MTTEWVDFKSVKATVNMEMILTRYGINNLTKGGDELRGPCPIHKGSQRSKNFTVNVRKNAFKCFSEGCGARGNTLDFVAAMEPCSIRDAALKLKEWFKIGESEADSRELGDGNEELTETSRGIYSGQDGSLFEVITNATSGEDFEALVVYRELFGDYRFWVAPAHNFAGSESHFTLVKEL